MGTTFRIESVGTAPKRRHYVVARSGNVDHRYKHGFLSLGLAQAMQRIFAETICEGFAFERAGMWERLGEQKAS